MSPACWAHVARLRSCGSSRDTGTKPSRRMVLLFTLNGYLLIALPRTNTRSRQLGYEPSASLDRARRRKDRQRGEGISLGPCFAPFRGLALALRGFLPSSFTGPLELALDFHHERGDAWCKLDWSRRMPCSRRFVTVMSWWQLVSSLMLTRTSGYKRMMLPSRFKRDFGISSTSVSFSNNLLDFSSFNNTNPFHQRPPQKPADDQNVMPSSSDRRGSGKRSSHKDSSRAGGSFTSTMWICVRMHSQRRDVCKTLTVPKCNCGNYNSYKHSPACENVYCQMPRCAGCVIERISSKDR
ncbi:hypothetical protein B0T19DRAFT_77845 [Cercophora scortea]|uniref:Uncharacterized protein n=1 Tax=Cercophora scortea TaxID=314031 RepID=A0AAE0J602_9PEZI|nr:hypothetical protein B0T19DRAFT_77845 [Cercophora scortea]